jgi:hypothetical protein
MITRETLEAVKDGILTDEQLVNAISHYTELERNLRCHGEVYQLVWKDVKFTLDILHGFRKARKRK